MTSRLFMYGHQSDKLLKNNQPYKLSLYMIPNTDVTRLSYSSVMVGGATVVHIVSRYSWIYEWEVFCDSDNDIMTTTICPCLVSDQLLKPRANIHYKRSSVPFLFMWQCVFARTRTFYTAKAVSSLISVVCTGLWDFFFLQYELSVSQFLLEQLHGPSCVLSAAFLSLYARRATMLNSLNLHNLAHISRMFDVAYLHSCLLFCSSVDTASGPVSDFHVYLWPCFFLSLSSSLLGLEKQWHGSQTALFLFQPFPAFPFKCSCSCGRSH